MPTHKRMVRISSFNIMLFYSRKKITDCAIAAIVAAIAAHALYLLCLPAVSIISIIETPGLTFKLPLELINHRIAAIIEEIATIKLNIFIILYFYFKFSKFSILKSFSKS